MTCPSDRSNASQSSTRCGSLGFGIIASALTSSPTAFAVEVSDEELTMSMSEGRARPRAALLVCPSVESSASATKNPITSLAFFFVPRWTPLRSVAARQTCEAYDC